MEKGKIKSPILAHQGQKIGAPLCLLVMEEARLSTGRCTSVQEGKGRLTEPRLYAREGRLGDSPRSQEA